MERLVITFAILAFTNCIYCTPMLRCSSDIPLPINAQFEDCEKWPCELDINSGNLTSIITFENPFEFVYEMSAELWIAIPTEPTNKMQVMDDDKVCDHLIEGSCPMKHGDKVTYEFNPLDVLFEQKFDYCEIWLAEFIVMNPQGTIACCQGFFQLGC